MRQGKVLGVEGILHDVTERKRAEEALRQANKKLNLLSGITRHDINNQLKVLMAYLALLEEMQPDPTLNEYCRKAATAAERISSMIRFMKEYEEYWNHDPRTGTTAAHLLILRQKKPHSERSGLKNDFPPVPGSLHRSPDCQGLFQPDGQCGAIRGKDFDYPVLG